MDKTCSVIARGDTTRRSHELTWGKKSEIVRYARNDKRLVFPKVFELKKGVKTLDQRIDVDKFVKNRQSEIEYLVNTALNRAGDIVKQKVAAGDVKATIQDVLPLLLYEVLITNTVAVLRLVAEMLEDEGEINNSSMDH